MIAQAPAEQERQALIRLREQLVSTYADRCPVEEIRAVVDRAWGQFTTARVRDFIPVLVERIARDELRHMAIRRVDHVDHG